MRELDVLIGFIFGGHNLHSVRYEISSRHRKRATKPHTEGNEGKREKRVKYQLLKAEYMVVSKRESLT